VKMAWWGDFKRKLWTLVLCHAHARVRMECHVLESVSWASQADDLRCCSDAPGFSPGSRGLRARGEGAMVAATFHKSALTSRVTRRKQVAVHLRFWESLEMQRWRLWSFCYGGHAS
jgi:hypothetical protein